VVLVFLVLPLSAFAQTAPPPSMQPPVGALPSGQGAPPPMTAQSQTQQYAQSCRQWLNQYRGQEALRMYDGLLAQGADAVLNCETVADYAALRAEERKYAVPQILASTYWSLRVQNAKRDIAMSESTRVWRHAIVAQTLGGGAADIFNAFVPQLSSMEAINDVYYKVYGYGNGWDAGYAHGVMLFHHVRAGGRADDATGRAIAQNGRNAVQSAMQMMPWAQSVPGVFWQGFADGFHAGQAEGSPVMRKPAVHDFNRSIPIACRGSDEPGYDDLRCRDINYGAGMLRRRR
jgi:hypothetical protein